MQTPIAHQMICHVQMEGMPKSQVLISLGLPNRVLPMTAPGPTPKKNHTKAKIHATGTKLLFSCGTPLWARKKSWNLFLCAASSAFCVKNEMAIATGRLNSIPQKAECNVRGQRPQASMPNQDTPILSVIITAISPKTKPTTTPVLVSQGK